MAPPAPRSIIDSPTPAQLAAQEADAAGHVTRGEFRELRKDVHEIKEALKGSYDEPGFLERFRKAEERIGWATKAAGLAFVGMAGMAGKWAWDKLTGHNP